jgi:hypothetical protein
MKNLLNTAIDNGSGRHRTSRFLIGALILFGLASPNAFAITAADEAMFGLEGGRPNWRLETEDGLTLVFERLYPDMVRAFMIGRGFNLEAANRYAGTCVYKSVLRNSANQGEMEFDLRNWQVLVDGKPKPLMIEPDWQKEWEKRSATQSARIAFKWGQFQPHQIHGPTDWLQGMSNMDLPPDTTFDLKVVWKRGGKTHQAILKNIQCGPPEKK